MAFGSLLKLVSIGLFIASIPATGGLSTGLVIAAMATGTIGAMLDQPKIPEQRAQIGMTLDPGAALPVVYGRAKVGSIVADWFIDPDTDTKILYMVTALCHGSRDTFGIGKIDEIWLDQKRAVVNPTDGGTAESGGNDVREHPYVLAGFDYQLQLGSETQNVGAQTLSGLAGAFTGKAPKDVTDSGWSATTDTGKGFAVLSMRFANVVQYVISGGGKDKEKENIFRGPPSVTAIVRGVLLEDPRATVSGVNIQFTNSGSADTITRASGSFTDDGWLVDDRVLVSGSASNDGTYTVKTVAATILTLTAVDSLTNEGPSGGITLKRWAYPTSGGGNNPALAIRDYLLSTTYGCGYAPALLNEASFAAAADYCDELIDYPLTAGRDDAARFSCNGVLDTGRSTRSNLDELLSSCRGQLVWEQGQFKLVIRRGNAVENGGFEDDIDGVIASAGGETLLQDSTHAYAGVFALKVTTVNSTGSGAQFTMRSGKKLLASAGKYYTASAQVYATGTAIGKTLRWNHEWHTHPSGGTSPSTTADTAVTLVSGWNTITSTKLAPATTRAVSPFLATDSAEGIFVVWMDAVSYTPAVAVALTVANIKGQWSFRNAGNADKWNLVTASFVDPLNGEFKAAQTQWPPIGSNAYLTADNDFLNRQDLSLPFTNDQAVAQSICQVLLNETRDGISCQVLCNEEAFAATVGDLVTVTHETPGWSVKPFWVTQVEARPDTDALLSLSEYQPDAYDLATMEDRRTYSATSHVPIDAPDTFRHDGYGPYDIVINGNFEKRTNGWQLGQGAVLETGADVYTGEASIKLPLSAGDPTPPFILQVTDTGNVPLIVRVQPGETLRITAAMKYDSAVTGCAYTLYVSEYDGDGVGSGIQLGPSWATELTYTVKSADVTVGAGAYFVNVFLAATAVVNAGNAWIDEIHLFRKAAP